MVIFPGFLLLSTRFQLNNTEYRRYASSPYFMRMLQKESRESGSSPGEKRRSRSQCLQLQSELFKKY